MFTTAVRNTDLKDGLPELDEHMFLVVPLVLLRDTSGDVPELVIVIEKHRSVTRKSTTPPLLMAPMRLQRWGESRNTHVLE
ncbi:hypothetical protein EJB05_42878, partial [Eragrostis curvula]